MSDIIKEAIKLRHELHMYPELSGKEQKTKEILIKFLNENTSLEIVDKGKWFYALHKGTGKCSDGAIAFRADFDAVKVHEINEFEYKSKNQGISHKCGHDGHSSALCAFAMKVDREKPNKEIYFIFQFGEETGEGAFYAKDLIKEKGIEKVYGVHNYPSAAFGTINLREGSMCCASVGMEIIFKGKSTHASTPELGINPAETISEIVLKLKDLCKIIEPKGILLATVVQIEVGERAFGVSASEGRLLLTIRGEYEYEMDMYIERISNLAEELSQKSGMQMEVNFYERFPDVQHSKETVEEIKAICADNNLKLNLMEAPLRTSEDFGYYLKEAKGALIWLGAGEKWPQLHSNDYDYNDDLIQATCQVFWAILKHGMRD